jgi:hypothetical protein
MGTPFRGHMYKMGAYAHIVKILTHLRLINKLLIHLQESPKHPESMLRPSSAIISFQVWQLLASA